MPGIQKAAYLAVCQKCLMHAHIVCSDGTESEEFSTQVEGAQEVHRLYEAGKIQGDERDCLIEQMGTAGLRLMHEVIPGFGIIGNEDELEELLITLFGDDEDDGAGETPLSRGSDMRH